MPNDRLRHLLRDLGEDRTLARPIRRILIVIVAELVDLRELVQEIAHRQEASNVE